MPATAPPKDPAGTAAEVDPGEDLVVQHALLAAHGHDARRDLPDPLPVIAAGEPGAARPPRGPAAPLNPGVFHEQVRVPAAVRGDAHPMRRADHARGPAR